MCRSFLLRLSVAFLLTALSMAPCVASVVYVDAHATGAGDGSSWTDAYTDLQTALGAGESADEIRVAQGRYTPAPPGGDRAASFVIDRPITIRGGYAGVTGLDPDDRNVEVYRAILSGDLDGNDNLGGDPTQWLDEPTRQDNSYHVVRLSGWGLGESVILDGLTICAGNANGPDYTCQSGAGVEAGQMTLVDCTIENNSAAAAGGGCAGPVRLIRCRVRNNHAALRGGGLSRPGDMESCLVEGNVAELGGGICEPSGYVELTDCRLVGNRARQGGGIWINNEVVTCRDCAFSDNRAIQGGGIWIWNDCTCRSELTLQRCRLERNAADESGGAIYQGGNARLEMASCLVNGNDAGLAGGLHAYLYQGMVGAGFSRVVNCTIVHNAAPCGGGIVRERDANGTFILVNSILWGNRDASGQGLESAQIVLKGIEDSGTAGSTPPTGSPGFDAVDYSCIEGWTGILGGTGNLGLPPLFVDAVGTDGQTGTVDDDVHLQPKSPCVDAGDGTYCSGVPGCTGTGCFDPSAADLDGRPRCLGQGIDLGAYELPSLRVWYVDDDANGLPVQDGLSWSTAFACLQDALTVATEDEEIHVAQGVYRPDQFSLSDRPNLGRAESFHLRTGVAIRGGYAGLGAADPDARDTERYETILSGDRLGDDVMLAGTEWEQVDDFVRSDTLLDNCVTVVTGVDVDASAVLDGVVITGGNANCHGGPRGRPESVGGGMYLVSASPTIVDCVFRTNMSQALWWIDCGLPDPPPDSEDEWPYFVRPRAAGGAVYIAEGGPTFHRCRFVHNVVYSGDVSAGGGALCSVSADPVLVECVFESNVATGFDDEYYGGAICALGGRPHLKGCAFSHNQAIYSSGGALHCAAVEVVLEDCTFMYNTARTSGGAMVLGEEGSSAAIRDCRFEGNQADRGGALYAGTGTLDIARSAFRGNGATYGGGAVDFWFGDLAFRNCLFAGNHTSSDGGAVHAFNSRLTAVGCTFADNAAGPRGGALAASHFAVISAENSIFSDNHAEEGTHIWASDETPVWLRYSDVTGGPAGISVDRPGDLHWGPGNIDAEPLFADAVGGDFHLKSQAGRWDAVQGAWVQDEVTSPCIDAGDPATPIMHEPFPNGGLVNMGAYGGIAEASKSWFNAPVCEVIVAGDINGDCRVDMGDLAIMACHWLEVQ